MMVEEAAVLIPDIPEAREIEKVSGNWLVLGPYGMLGTEFRRAAGPGAKLTLGNRTQREKLRDSIETFREVDVTNPSQDLEAIAFSNIDYIVNFAAETDVAQAQLQLPGYPGLTSLEETDAYKRNVDATQNILDALVRTTGSGVGKHIPAVFIGSDFGFDGKRPADSPLYTESSPMVQKPEDTGVYGLTKKMARDLFLKYQKEHNLDILELIIAYPYVANFPNKGDLIRNIVDWIIRDESGRIIGLKYPLYDDQIITPTDGRDISKAMMHLIRSGLRGSFAVTSPEPVTPHQMGLKVVELVQQRDLRRGKISEGQLLTPDQIREVVKAAKLADQQAAQVKAFQEGKRPNYPVIRPVHGGLSPQKIIDTGFTPTVWYKGVEDLFAA